MNNNSDDLPQIIVNPVPGFDSFIEEMELYECLEQIDSEECLLKLRRRKSDLEWATFCIENFDSFKMNCADDAILCAALDLWRDRREQAHIAQEKRQQWEEDVLDKMKFFMSCSSSIGSENGMKLDVTSQLPRLSGSEATIKLTSYSGLLLRYPYDRSSSDVFDRNELMVHSPQLSVRLKKPVITKREFGASESISLIGVFAELRNPTGIAPTRVVHFLASKKPHEVLLDMEDLPWGGASRRVCELNVDGGKATLRITDDPYQLFNKEYLKALQGVTGDLAISTLTIEGSELISQLDKILFSLFLATGYEFTIIESQEVACSGEVVAIKIPTYAHRSFVQAPVVSNNQFIETPRIKQIFDRTMALPEISIDSKKRFFSEHHFRAIVHGMLNAWKQPIQKSIVDLYQVIDSLANCHPSIPTSKRSTEDFQQLKSRQKALLKLIPELDSSIFDSTNTDDVANTPEDLKQALVDLQTLVENQSNYLGVSEKIRRLLQETGVPFDKDNKAHKSALDLRNKISHSLAAVKIKEPDDEQGAYSLHELLEIRNILWNWCVLIVERMLEQ